MINFPTPILTQEELATKTFLGLDNKQALALLFAICDFAKMPQFPPIEGTRQAILDRFERVKNWGINELHEAVEVQDTSLT